MSRHSDADIVFQGVNITSDISSYLLSVTYTDNEDGETDDLQIKLQDRPGIWLKSWLSAAMSAAVTSTQPTAQATQQTAAATTITATVNAKSGLVLRAGPSTSTARLTAAPHGATVTVKNQSGSWWECEYGGQSGYMWNSYLTPATATQQAQAQEQTQTADSKPSFLIQSVFHRYDWMGSGTDETLDTGVFELDAVDCSGPPSTITIKATSLPYSAPIRQTKKSKAWENYKLSGIANEMAANAGMTVMYLSVADPDIAREEQSDESDITFITRIAHAQGLACKATNKNIVIFDQMTYEKMASVRTITNGDGTYSKYKVSTSNANTQYTSCRVRYVNPQGVLIEGIAKTSDYDADAKAKEAEAAAKAASKKTSTTSAEQQAKEAKENAAQQLEIWQAVGSIAEAKALAEKMLRMHNKFAKTCSFTVPGDPSLVAGANVDIKGFGPFDGKYVINQAKHSIGTSGYQTTISLRNTLEGY